MFTNAIGKKNCDTNLTFAFAVGVIYWYVKPNYKLFSYR